MPGLPLKVNGLCPLRITGAATVGWRLTALNTDWGSWVIACTIAVGAACQGLAGLADPAGPTPHPITDTHSARLAV
jgi:hypothetical protein